jgi:hypothetical protein
MSEPNDVTAPVHPLFRAATPPPIAVPDGHIGPVTLPGSGRQVWWTGRVAIGLRHEPSSFLRDVPDPALCVQVLMQAPQVHAAG